MHACQESLLHTRDPGQRNFALLVGGIGRLDYPSFSSISLVLEVHKTQLMTSSHRHHCHVDDNWWHCTHRSIYTSVTFVLQVQVLVLMRQPSLQRPPEPPSASTTSLCSPSVQTMTPSWICVRMCTVVRYWAKFNT